MFRVIVALAVLTLASAAWFPSGSNCNACRERKAACHQTCDRRGGEFCYLRDAEPIGECHSKCDKWYDLSGVTGFLNKSQNQRCKQRCSLTRAECDLAAAKNCKNRCVSCGWECLGDARED